MSTTLDAGVASLLSDLDARGLLASTLLVCMGEFGLTPKINVRAGRDHWPRAWSAMLAGGGLGRGQVVGRTSSDGMEVDESPVSVPDLTATILQTVGVDPRKQYASNVGRPIRAADPAAKPIGALL